MFDQQSHQRTIWLVTRPSHISPRGSIASRKLVTESTKEPDGEALSFKSAIFQGRHLAYIIFRYGYVRHFEQPDSILPNTWIVVRIDGHSFHKFTARYNFTKPNDLRALHLMNAAAEYVLTQLPDISLAYGQSDEYSFLFPPTCDLYERRAAKLVSTIVSIFSTAYVLFWPQHFPGTPLTPPFPSFDGRAVAYPSLKNMRDYFCWRQVDCHINNLYNTSFWTLVNKGGLSRPAAEKELSGTLAADKNEILHSRFGINYNEEQAIFRKGSVIFRDYFVEAEAMDTMPAQTDAAANAELGEDSSGSLGSTRRNPTAGKPHTESQATDYSPSANSHGGKNRRKQKSRLTTAHIDIMKDDFWINHAWLLETGSSRKRVVRKLLEERVVND